MNSPEDTQPRSPFRASPYDEQPVSGGPGCWVWGLIGLMISGLALLIITLSAFAGWSSGQRIAQGNATATQSAVISEQLTRIPFDVSSSNQTLLQKRLEYLVTLTPAVPGLDVVIQTATALYQTSLPTPTAPPTTAPTLQPTIAATAFAAGTLDLPSLLAEAQNDISLRDWDRAIDTLDVILAADSTFQTALVRDLILQALTAKALALYRSADASDLAEANLLSDRAKQFGDIGDLAYESYIASLYLDAVNTIGIDYATAIQRLQAVYDQAPAYKDVAVLLFNQYSAYGDALVIQGQVCLAFVQYQGALRFISDSGVAAKLTAAETACANPTPLLVTPGEGTIAPVGVGG